jgi:MFS superfamily sulfate permease-like transporter
LLWFADSSFVPPLIYAALGSSRHIAIGPVAVVSILLGNLLKNEIPDTKSPDYLHLAFTATFFAGVVQAAVGFIRCVAAPMSSLLQYVRMTFSESISAI